MERDLSRIIDQLADLPASEVFRLIAESIPAFVAVLLPNWEVESLNRHVLDYFGMTLAELKDWQMAGVVHQDDLPAVIEAVTRSVQTGEPYEIEHRMRRADGVFRWFQVRAMPLRDREGRILRWYCLQVDIDDRKRAEILSAGERRVLEAIACGRPLPGVLNGLCELWDSTTEGCPSGILLFDRTSTRVEHAVGPALQSKYNAAFLDSVLQPRTGPCGLALHTRRQVVVSDVATDTRFDRDGWPAMVLEWGVRSCWSTPILSLTGDPLGSFAVYSLSGGSPTPHHEAVIRKLTHIAAIAIERTRNEEALRRTEAFQTEAEHLSNTGSFSLNPVTGAHWWSRQTYRIFGVDPWSPPTFDAMRERVHPDDRELLEHGLASALRGEGFSLGFRLQMPDGKVKYLQVVAHAMGSSSGEAFEFVGAVQDVTERRLDEEALGKARADLAHVARVTSLGALTASIAHEVSQPLSGILTNARACLRFLDAGPPDLEGARDTARRTIRDGGRASEVISRLRSLFGNQAPAAESVDLNEATREVIALSESELQKARVLVRLELADDLPRVTGDRVQLQQVVLNLLLSAVEAMSAVDDRPRQLWIRTGSEAELVHLSVRDSGVGIDPQIAGRLFDPFYTTKKGGMGIGLSVSRSIIERHDGRLWAAPNDGSGATFSFSIPRAPEDPIAPLSTAS